MNKRTIGLATIAILFGLSCGDSGPGDPTPVAGNLTFSLTTPNADDGAVLITMTATGGNTITAIAAACSGCLLFSEIVSATQVKGVVTGTLSAGPLVRITVSDANTPSAYSGQINQVASTTFEVRSTSGYALTVQ